MKQVIVIVIIIIVGLGAGLAAGIMITNSKSKITIADMQAKMQKSETEAQEKISGYDLIVNQLNIQLQQAKAEIETLKKPAPIAAPAAEAAVIAPAENEKTAAAPADNSIPENTKLYAIQNGDSLWSIAQKQLGNGNRFKEILKLNPRISAKSNLAVGTKLKIPAK
ncbi:MAG: LysM domain-containing protein [Phycisphaerae bacterium]|jgi:LysM repeat protein